MSIFKKNESSNKNEFSSLSPELSPSGEFIPPNQNVNDVTDMANRVNDATVERGSPQVNNTKKSGAGKVLTYGIGFLAVAGIIGSVFLFVGNDKGFLDDTTAAPSVGTVSNTRPKTFDTKLPPEPVVQTPPPPSAEAETLATEHVMPEQAVVVNGTNYAPPADPEEPNRLLMGSVMLPVTTSSNSERRGDEQYAEEGTMDSPLGNRLRPTVTASTRAKRRSDMTYLMKKGTNIACTLDTKIVTTHPGITRCLVSKDVYSADGKVLLVERGSEVIGEQTTSLLHGQAKVFVLWNTITTPHGVTLDIASPSADSLGASGQDAQVDRHFWERFGGAIMLSLIDDGLVILGDKINRHNNSITYDSTSDTFQNMAAEALRNTINIPPTGYVNQGTMLNIMVARDVDFSPIYELVTPQFY
ncbi:type IV secretion system protein VirB10 [Oligella urethralis]|uniref:Type IV secretion system protein virB10 n=1 Tax=Oligella urethralis TaxID=90245 RepID=A0A2X1UN04_9BURK|nr:type IV secretion system protein VirB10 [Oligella urethralis]SPY08438.1 Type IV secretion system protein virB10 [Oligella urethralis]